MLVLTRKAGESIEMDGPGKITVLEIDRGAVKIGMEAPPTVRILRSELRQQEAARGRSQDAAPPYAPRRRKRAGGSR
jgi:carbon storage regulator